MPEDLLGAIRAAKDDLPDTGAVDRIAAGLAPNLAGPIGGGDGGAGGPAAGSAIGDGGMGGASAALASAATGGLSAVGKWAAITAGAAVVAGGVVWSVQRGPEPGPAPATPAVETTVSPEPPVEIVEPEATGFEPVLPTRDELDESPASETTPRRATRRRNRRTPVAAPEPVDETTEDEAGLSPLERTPEGRLLARARRVLPSSPASALSLIAQHRSEFPSSVFAQEREVIAIDALARLGRTDQARARAARFQTRHPSSIHQRTLQSILDRLAD